MVEGVETLCKDLQVDPSDPLLLALAWRLGAERMCYFTRAQWRRLAGYHVKTVADLKRLLPTLMQEALANFKDFYSFGFRFGLDAEKGERVLPIDIAVGLWQLLFSDPGRRSAHLAAWLAFLQERKTRGITKDTWDLFLVFTDTVAPDCSNYSEEEAWPSLLDDFVASVRSAKQ
jgi:hypothetical protein